jgi:hypothetical protein
VGNVNTLHGYKEKGVLNLKIFGKIKTNSYYVILIHKRKHYYALVWDIKENIQIE